MSLQGRFNRVLDSIPGYDGYRDRERIRDADRAVRERLAADYDQLAERLQRLAATQASARRLTAVQDIDAPFKRLQSFIDGLRTATYGYAPLFSATSSEEGILRQIVAFDRSLADGLDTLSEQINSLEVADPESEEFRRAVADVSAAVEQLHSRFKRRQDIIESGTKLPEQEVLALLERPTDRHPVAFRLHQGDAVSYEGVNYSIVGRVAVETESEIIRAFQLQGGSGDIWLQASSDATQQIYWLRRMQKDVPVGSETITVDDTVYRLDQSRTGKGEIIGAGGTAKDQMVRFLRYVSGPDARVLFAYDWGAELLVLLGLPVDPALLELYSREV